MGGRVGRLAVGTLGLLAIGVTLAWPGAAQAGSAFALGCQYSHSLVEDAILAPGDQPQPNGHMHDFIGNSTANANTTYLSLRAGSTSCFAPSNDFEADKSAYWFPTMYERQADGSLLQRKAYKAVIYYDGNSATERFPLGMRYIGGNASATSPQPTNVVLWSCVNGAIVDNKRPWCVEDNVNPYPPKAVMRLIFPDCWDGVESDWNFTSHMAYRTTSACPAGFPRRVPQIMAFVYYDTRGGPDADSPTEGMIPGAVKLSSGGHYSAHGDFFDGWDPVKLQLFIERCFKLDAC